MGWNCKINTSGADMKDILFLTEDKEGKLSDVKYLEKRNMRTILRPDHRSFVVKHKQDTVIECHQARGVEKTSEGVD